MEFSIIGVSCLGAEPFPKGCARRCGTPTPWANECSGRRGARALPDACCAQLDRWPGALGGGGSKSADVLVRLPASVGGTSRCDRSVAAWRTPCAVAGPANETQEAISERVMEQNLLSLI